VNASVTKSKSERKEKSTVKKMANFNFSSTNSTSRMPVDKLVRVGNYELEKTIGKGNFAIVKLASNLITNSKVKDHPRKKPFFVCKWNFFAR
jgi:hypothetical protein